MLRRLRHTVDAMSRLLRQQEKTANNLANTNTVGYKRGRTFTHLLSNELRADDHAASQHRIQQWTDTSQGALETTGSPLDLALQGDGMFVVRNEEGQARYTRAGHFTLGPEGVLQTANGLTVEGESGLIHIPDLENSQNLTITENGTIRLNDRKVGKLRIVQFQDPEALQRESRTRFRASGQIPERVFDPQVKQGALEQSNVDPVQALTNMIDRTNAFESHQRWLRTTDSILSRVSRELGRF